MNEEYNDKNGYGGRGGKGPDDSFNKGGKKTGGNKGPGTILIIVLATVLTSVLKRFRISPLEY